MRSCERYPAGNTVAPKALLPQSSHPHLLARRGRGRTGVGWWPLHERTSAANQISALLGSVRSLRPHCVPTGRRPSLRRTDHTLDRRSAVMAANLTHWPCWLPPALAFVANDRNTPRRRASVSAARMTFPSSSDGPCSTTRPETNDALGIVRCRPRRLRLYGHGHLRSSERRLIEIPKVSQSPASFNPNDLSIAHAWRRRPNRLGHPTIAMHAVPLCRRSDV